MAKEPVLNFVFINRLKINLKSKFKHAFYKNKLGFFDIWSVSL
jgi:hypothetical protein